MILQEENKMDNNVANASVNTNYTKCVFVLLGILMQDNMTSLGNLEICGFMRHHTKCPGPCTKKDGKMVSAKPHFTDIHSHFTRLLKSTLPSFVTGPGNSTDDTTQPEKVSPPCPMCQPTPFHPYVFFLLLLLLITTWALQSR